MEAQFLLMLFIVMQLVYYIIVDLKLILCGANSLLQDMKMENRNLENIPPHFYFFFFEQIYLELWDLQI